MRRWELLEQLINERELKQIAEVGVGDGKTARYVLENCPCVEMYYAVDLWEPTPGHGAWFNHAANWSACTEIAAGDKRMHMMQYDATHAATLLRDQHLDLVFVDADHDYDSVLHDLQIWYPKVKVGGWLCGHDISKPGVDKAVREFVRFVPGLETRGDDITWWHQKQSRRMRMYPEN